MQFPLVLTPDDDGTFMVTCPLLPELTSFGEDHDDALAHGRDAVEEAIAARMARWEDIAWPQREDMVPACRENRAVALSMMASLKASLYAACKGAAVSRAELARRLSRIASRWIGCFASMMNPTLSRSKPRSSS
jgi:antitoxin HicB